MTTPAGSRRPGLFVDLYEVTMAASFWADGLVGEAVFEVFVRDLPPGRRFLVVAGVDEAIDALVEWRWSAADLETLASIPGVGPEMAERLDGHRFSGRVDAIAEGELVAPGTPIVTVTASLPEAQLGETLLLNLVGFSTMVATKAAHIALAGDGRGFVDFSARRDHGTEAAVLAARASFVGGADATSLVEAGRRYAIPLAGTMAHSYVMAHDGEVEAFAAHLRRHGPGAVLLVDTYDTVEGVRRAIRAMTETGITARAVRLDSGDLGSLAVAVRAELDAAGFGSVQIVASGDLDETRIAELVAAGAPIDTFGVGTRMGTSADQPYLSIVYKLVQLDGVPRHKRSPGKVSLPGVKQAWRRGDEIVVELADAEPIAGGRPLLRPVVIAGERVVASEPLAAIRERCRLGMASPPAPTVAIGPALAALAARSDAERDGGPDHLAR